MEENNVQIISKKETSTVNVGSTVVVLDEDDEEETPYSTAAFIDSFAQNKSPYSSGISIHGEPQLNVEEEDRVLYVAMTRAKDVLILADIAIARPNAVLSAKSAIPIALKTASQETCLLFSSAIFKKSIFLSVILLIILSSIFAVNNIFMST